VVVPPGGISDSATRLTGTAAGIADSVGRSTGFTPAGITDSVARLTGCTPGITDSVARSTGCIPQLGLLTWLLGRLVVHQVALPTDPLV
jgi:hypothetical protein